jgi:hypothetical protein
LATSREAFGRSVAAETTIDSGWAMAGVTAVQAVFPPARLSRSTTSMRASMATAWSPAVTNTTRERASLRKVTACWASALMSVLAASSPWVSSRPLSQVRFWSSMASRPK